MRVVKFRAWNITKSRMVSKLSTIHFKLNILVENAESGWDWYKDEYELMQYTGLKDKNGEEIYEGDIVKYKVKGSNKICKTVIEFNEEHGAFLFGIYEGVKMPCGKKTRMNKYTRKSVGSVEVIGNKYMNPELLEVKQ